MDDNSTLCAYCGHPAKTLGPVISGTAKLCGCGDCLRTWLVRTPILHVGDREVSPFLSLRSVRVAS